MEPNQSLDLTVDAAAPLSLVSSHLEAQVSQGIKRKLQKLA
jgi:hypothetical protein